jgi:hypothetical protein
MTALPTIAGSVRVLPVVLFGQVAAVVVARFGHNEHRLMPTNPTTPGQARWSR